MNEDNAALVELRKISAWADMQRKATKWSLIFVAIFVPIVIGVAIVMETKLGSELKDRPNAPEGFTWYDVDRNVGLGDPSKAIEIGEDLIQRTPLYPDGHRRLALAYLAAGQVERAKERFRQAARLYPSRENQAAVEAVEQRIREQSSEAGAGK